MKKTNAQIELECFENIRARLIAEKRDTSKLDRHIRDLRRRIAGKYNV